MAATFRVPRLRNSRRTRGLRGARFAVACGNGTDAIQLALMAKGIGRGDAVLVPDFTFTATAEAVALVGATPIFVDVQADDFNIDSNRLAAGLQVARDKCLKPRALIAVDLFGLPADYDALNAFCQANELLLIADAAQSFGATFRGRKVGTLAPITTTSFFPAKPLGCYGDGGAILTDDAELVAALKSLRVHGQGNGQVRQRPHRREQPARHPPGRDPDVQARRSSRTRSRPAERRGALQWRWPIA